MKNANFTSLPKKTAMIFFVATALMFKLSSCSEVPLEDLSPRTSDTKQQSLVMETESLIALRASANTTITELQFTATAMIAHCYGENITFTGTIENRVTTTTDAEGEIHYTRSFNTKGMTAKGQVSGTEYDVIGGAEMFAIKDAVFINGGLSLPASLAESDIVIHQGTLVFESRTDRSRVVAQHIIRKLPGQDRVVNTWECRGN
jgi:hypothetical protein